MDILNWLLLKLGDCAQWLYHDGLDGIAVSLAWLSDQANPLLVPPFRVLNILSNAVADLTLWPIRILPGLLSNTIISAVTGFVLLIVFKYTSNQKAIGRVKNNIKANMLALKLFKDDLRVTIRLQGRVLYGVTNLLRYSLFPLLVMILPMSLELGQLGLWYQWQPLNVGEETLVTVKVRQNAHGRLPDVRLESCPGVEILVGPFRIPSKSELCWRIRITAAGMKELNFQSEGQLITKSLQTGEGLARVSPLRPSSQWTCMLVYPAESPFDSDSVVQSIHIDFPSRTFFASGSNWWLIYFLIASMLFALLFKTFLKVQI